MRRRPTHLAIAVLLGFLRTGEIAAAERAQPTGQPAAPVVTTNLVVVTNIVVVTNLVVSTNTIQVTNRVGTASPAVPPENVFATAWWSKGLNYRLTQRIALGITNAAGQPLVNERISLTVASA